MLYLVWVTTLWEVAGCFLMNNDVETSLFEKHGDGNSLVSLSINSHQGVVRHRKEIAEYLQKLDEVISKYGASKLWIFAG